MKIKRYLNNIVNFVYKYTHRHDYVKIGYHQECDDGIRYSVRHYKCSICGKEIQVDGRFDIYEKRVYNV